VSQDMTVYWAFR